MKYTGTEAVAPSPELLSINNDQPQFNAGWSIADRLFISEDVVSGIHEATKTFVIPADAVEFAVIIYPTESQTPTNMVLNDFEGDITPWFNRMVVTDSSHISEKYLEYVTHSENQFHSFRVLKRNPVKAWLGKRGEKHNKSIGVIAYNTITNEKKDMVP